MYKRNTTADIISALKDSPVVLINGARQVGKSTLASSLIEHGHKAEFVTLDDPATLAAASSSPLSFLEGFLGNLAIDEIQRAPELFLSLKKLIDQDRKPGRFLLTGSANVMTLPKLADSLAGRMEIHTLWPLSQGEIEGHKEKFIDNCFNSKPLKGAPITWPKLMQRVSTGGYPESLRRSDPKRRRAWYSGYLASILERDVRDLANIEGLRELPNLLLMLAARSGGLLNFSEISRVSRISNSTLKRYLALLETVFLVVTLPAWFRNAEKRLVKSPKIYLNDTGLLTHLRGLDTKRLVQDRNAAGAVLENFVVMELMKQRGWCETQPMLYHFRTQIGREVDIVMEAPDGRLVGIEVKCRSEVSLSDFGGLKALQELAGKSFARGIVLYTGQQTLNFSTNLTALPIGALWR